MNQQNPYRQEASYDNIPQPGNPTYSEAWALVEAARRMAAPIKYGALETPEDMEKVRTALRLNWRLWTIFQADLSVEDGQVPDSIRGNMLSLCNFVDKHSVETLSEPTVERVMVLIDINRQIANGLLESLQGATTVSDEQAPERVLQATSPNETLTSIDTDV